MFPVESGTPAGRWRSQEVPGKNLTANDAESHRVLLTAGPVFEPGRVSLSEKSLLPIARFRLRWAMDQSTSRNWK